MKRLFLSLLIVFISVFSINLVSIADATWSQPKRIKTYIPSNKRSTMMEHAFARWTKATNGKLVFQYVQDPKYAQITVEFVNIIPNADREIGLTRSSFNPESSQMKQAKIYIAEKTSTGVQLGDDAVFTVMIHEIGHALGIHNHSSDPESIMYPYEDDKQEILNSDLSTLNALYNWK